MTDQVAQSRPFGKFIERLTGLNLLFRTNPIIHPLLRQDLRDIRWLQPDPRTRIHRLIARRVRWAVILTLVLLLIDLIATVQVIQTPVQTQPYVYYSINVPSQHIYLGAVFIAFALIIVGDFWYLFRGLRAILPERETGHWDMIRLTPLPPSVLVRTKYVAVQLQSWRVLGAELLPRLYLLFAIAPLTAIWIVQYALAYMLYTYHYQNDFVQSTIISSAILIAGLLLFALETIWRMRAITAVGLALSARSRTSVNGFISGFLLMIGIHIVQFVWIVLAVFLFNRFSLFLSFNRMYDYSVRNLLSGGLSILVSAILHYSWLRLVREIALRYALKHAFRDV